MLPLTHANALAGAFLLLLLLGPFCSIQPCTAIEPLARLQARQQAVEQAAGKCDSATSHAATQQQQQLVSEATAGGAAAAADEAAMAATKIVAANAAIQQQQRHHAALPAGIWQTAAAARHHRILQQQSQQSQQRTKAVPAVEGPVTVDPSAFQIPVPAPGVNIPAEPLVPLYSPDQLRLRLPLIPDVPLDGQIISLLEQLQQAANLNLTLTKEQLEYAYPLLNKKGKVKLPNRSDPSQYPDGYVAICAIVKDQHQDLREWLEYYKYIGIKKVYIYDNNSTEPLANHIADFMHSGFVEYAFFIGQPRYRDLFRTSSQWWAYNDCITRFRHRHHWLAFIDADEFIVFHDQAPSSNIDRFMQDYEMYGGLALNWVVFGSSGHKARPKGGVLVNYHQCLPFDQEQNQHVKVIANTAYLMTIGDDPHRVYYNTKSAYTVNELGQQVTGAKSPPSHTKAALYHYLTKSESEYMQKMKRGSAAGNYKSPEFFYAINGLATGKCTLAIPLGLKCCPSVTASLGPAEMQRIQAVLAAAN